MFDCIRYSNNRQSFQEYVLNNSEFKQLDEDAYDVISRYTNFLKRDEISAKSKGEGGKIDMCQAVTELMEESKAEGRAEGRAGLVLDLLKRIGQISDELFQRIMQERDTEVLCNWATLAVGANSVAEFEKKMG